MLGDYLLGSLLNKMKCGNCGTKNHKLVLMFTMNVFSEYYAPCKNCGEDLIDEGRVGRLVFCFLCIPVLFHIFGRLALNFLMLESLFMEFVLVIFMCLLVVGGILKLLPWKQDI